jgi:integrase
VTGAAGRKVSAIHGGAITLTAAADAFLSTPRMSNPNTRRAYAGAIDQAIAVLGPGRLLTDVSDHEVGTVAGQLWGGRAEATWNRNRAAISSWLTWCQTRKHWPAPSVPADCERRREHPGQTVPKAAIERLLTRRDIPLRGKTLWRMLYETAARTSEILALNVEDLDLENRKAPIRSKGGAKEEVYWGTGTAHLLPRLLRLPGGTSRTSGPLFLSERKPVPARRPGPRDICPHTGRPRLGYDRCRVLLRNYTITNGVGAWELHQFRHSSRRQESSAGTHHGQDQAQVAPHRHALHQTRRRGHHRGHRAPRSAPAQSLRPSVSVPPRSPRSGLTRASLRPWCVRP